MITQSEKLLLQSETYKDVVKFIEKEIKEKYPNKEDLFYESIGLMALVEIKIKFEKYSKKLKHEADEIKYWSEYD